VPDLSVNTEFSRIQDIGDPVGRVNQHLGGDTPYIDARSPHVSPVDEGDVLIGCEGLESDAQSDAGADDDDIVFFHDSSIVNERSLYAIKE
jgi:hypothetical protein